MNALDELIRNRRSVFPAQYNGQVVPESLIKRMLENALWAPTHYKTQPWQFIVFSEKSKNALLDHLAFMYSMHTPEDQFSQAKYNKFEERKSRVSHIIAIVMRRHEREGLPEEEEIAAVAMAVQNMWLTLASEPGHGGYWSSGNLVYQPELAVYLNLQPHERCLGLFYVGCTNTDLVLPEAKRNPLEEHARWE